MEKKGVAVEPVMSRIHFIHCSQKKKDNIFYYYMNGWFY